ncbi:MAG: type I phosphomannose isomerase catalytic subunit [Eubacteriales bacterium]
MYPFKLKPAVKDYMWGGDRLKHEYGIESPDSIIAEAWMLSCNANGASTIMNGSLAGKSLADALFSDVEKALGINNSFAVYFPVLIKFIDARDDLSIQVHPSNGYAWENEGEFGKTEMWYVLDAQEGAFLYYGFSRAVTREELRERIEDNTIIEILNRVTVKKGDVFFLEAGTIHTIGKGIMIAEIQQNSDSTYRVYDYNRTDSDGKKRELHIEKALDVINTNFVPGIPKEHAALQKPGYRVTRLASCVYFTVDHLSIDSFAKLECDGKSFTSLLLIEGSGNIRFDNREYGEDGAIAVSKGDSLFLPAGTGAYRIEGRCCVLVTVR